MSDLEKRDRWLGRARFWLTLFIAGLVLSGLTALPLERELSLLMQVAGPGTRIGVRWPDLASWLALVSHGVRETGQRFPFFFYGSDWLAFAHFAIAVALVGPWRDPVRNVWVASASSHAGSWSRSPSSPERCGAFRSTGG
jgi:hypothetical protein